MLSYIKRRYYDLRQAWGLVAPLFAFTNFILIAYNFTGLKDLLPVEYFVIFFTSGTVVIFFLIGKIFRKKQLTTDLNLSYEQAGEAAKTSRIQLETYKLILQKLNSSIPNELENRIEYLRKIEAGNL